MKFKVVKPVIGLLGGVGAGKSTVAAEFARLGFRVIDGDAIGHELLKTASVKRLLRKQWGSEIFTDSGEVDRLRLAARVFAEPRELAKLNRILHPRIGRRIRRQINQARRDAGTPAIVLDAAVMLEAGWDKLCTCCVFVHAGGKIRQARAVGRGIKAQQWTLREKSQISLDRKAAACEYTVDNSSSIPLLREQVRQIYRTIVNRTACR